MYALFFCINFRWRQCKKYSNP